MVIIVIVWLQIYGYKVNVIRFFFSTQFLFRAICTQEPRRDPSNRRLNEHGIYIRHCQESNSQPDCGNDVMVMRLLLWSRGYVVTSGRLCLWGHGCEVMVMRTREVRTINELFHLANNVQRIFILIFVQIQLNMGLDSRSRIFQNLNGALGTI